jgi:hypothetical protein
VSETTPQSSIMMTSHLRIFAQPIKSSVATSCVLSLLLTIAPIALAEYEPDPGQPPPKEPTGTTGPRAYNPPPDQPPPTTKTPSTGSRGGCETIGGAPLTALAPTKHVGQTTSGHPTFAWFVPDAKPFPMQFKLFELAENNTIKLVHKLELQSSSGIMKLSLPKDKPGLRIGQRYLWQVSISCDPNFPSSDKVARAEIQVVEMPSTLKNALSTSKNRLEMAELYAKAGLWYDALGEALEAAGDSRLGQATTNLLEDLIALEEPPQRENLRQIVSSKK